MATFSNNQTLAIASAVSVVLGSYTVASNQYFQGQAAISAGAGNVLISGVIAASLTAGSVAGTQAVITAGPGAIITSTGGTIALSGCVFVNTP